MDFDTSETVNEEELASLDLKKKDDALIDTDEEVTEEDLIEEAEKEDTEHGYYGDDKDYERLILDPYEDNPEY